MITFELFTPLIINCLVIFGVYAVTREGMLLEKISKLLVKVFGEFYSKPFTECPTCMSSIWGTLFYFVFVSQGFLLWPFYLLALAGLIHIVNSKL